MRESAQPGRIKRRILLRRVAVVSWISFLSAAVATMVFFAMFDPEGLAQVTTFPLTLSRTQGYSLGFFLFWALTFISGSMVAWMLSLPIAKLRKPSRSDLEVEESE
ncbi:MAG: hypothetical protein ACQES2_04130 [Pseudomonadota bacterium]